MSIPTNFEFSPDEDQLLLFDENVVLEAVETKSSKCNNCFCFKFLPHFQTLRGFCFDYFKCVGDQRKDKK